MEKLKTVSHRSCLCKTKRNKCGHQFVKNMIVFYCTTRQYTQCICFSSIITNFFYNTLGKTSTLQCYSHILCYLFIHLFIYIYKFFTFFYYSFSRFIFKDQYQYVVFFKMITIFHTLYRQFLIISFNTLMKNII